MVKHGSPQPDGLDDPRVGVKTTGHELGPVQALPDRPGEAATSKDGQPDPAAGEEFVEIPLRLLGQLFVFGVIPGLDVGVVQGEQGLVDVVCQRRGRQQRTRKSGARTETKLAPARIKSRSMD